MNDLKLALRMLQERGIWPSMRTNPTDKRLIHLAESCDFHWKQLEEAACVLKEWADD